MEFGLLTCIVTGGAEVWVVKCQCVGAFRVPKNKGRKEAYKAD